MTDTISPHPPTRRFLIYAAYGYTGVLTVRHAVDRGMAPILAGRDPKRLDSLCQAIGRDLDYRVFGLDDTPELDRALRDVDVVLNCAGPFGKTHRPMAEACIRTGTHYLDISGEIPVYESLWRMDDEAKQNGVMLLPGIGFDVVPTDCLAALLKSRLPTATHLELAIASVGPAKVSRGTAKTFLEGMGRPGSIRKDGAIVAVPHLSTSRRIDFGHGLIDAPRMVIADVFSAYHSTGIPNIETYVAIPAALRVILKMLRPLGPALSSGLVHRLIKRLIDVGSVGPSDEDRAVTHAIAWGEVRDPESNTQTARVQTPEAYTFTALSALEAVKRVMHGHAPPGYQTPSTAFGAEFVLGIEGVELLV